MAVSPRSTKIIATIGPASNSEERILDLVRAGVDIFRLNFSHGTHETHAIAIERIRTAAADVGRSVAIMQDLSGPKIRTGLNRGGDAIPLTAGAELRIVIGDEPGEPGRVSTTYAPLAEAVHPGDALLLDDGRIQLQVVSSRPGEILTRVIDGGQLGEHKGINAPGVVLPSAGLTKKDAADLEFGVQAGVDWIALSFVQSAADLQYARAALKKAGAPALPLVAKLERPEAVVQLEAILEVSDAVMVARGDLGLEMPLEEVPRVQKEIIRKARSRGVPVIVATQVLESMRTEPRPTRAEVSDAANAVEDRVDAIMLAGETASGQHPLRAVQVLDTVIRAAETIPPIASLAVETNILADHARSICEAAVTVAQSGEAAAIVAIARGGKTARVLSALRPPVPIFGATDQPGISRRLTMTWGVVPVLTDLSGDLGTAASRIGEDLVSRGAIPPGSIIVLVSVHPDPARGPSNFLKLQRV